MKNESFEQWGILELFGHNKIAGLISEQSVGGCSFVRVDVPEIGKNPPFTKLYGQGAIYGMTFTDEITATAAAKEFHPRPINSWEAHNLLIDHDAILSEDTVKGGDDANFINDDMPY